MRNFAIVLLASISLAVGMRWLGQPPPLGSFPEEVPAETFALLLLDPIPTSLEFLERLDWSSFAEFDTDELKERLASELGTEVIDGITGQVRAVGVAVQALARKDRGELRIEFVARVVPRRGSPHELFTLIDGLIQKRFGEGMESTREAGQITYVGAQPGEYLVVERLDSHLNLSNSESAWRAQAEVRSGKAPALSQQTSYRRIIETVDPDSQLFLYVRGDGTFIPEFGYAIRRLDSEPLEVQYLSP